MRTIDSFMSTVFRASAIDFGFGPEFEIVLDPGPSWTTPSSLFLREARRGKRARRPCWTAPSPPSSLDFKGEATTRSPGTRGRASLRR